MFCRFIKCFTSHTKCSISLPEQVVPQSMRPPLTTGHAGYVPRDLQTDGGLKVSSGFLKIALKITFKIKTVCVAQEAKQTYNLDRNQHPNRSSIAIVF